MSIDITSVNNGDTYIRQDVPSDNQGTNTTMSLQWYQPFIATNHCLIQFLLPSTNLGNITQIRLFLYNTGGNAGGADADLYTCNAFTESTVTFSSAPATITLVSSIDASSTTAGWRYWVVLGASATNSQNSLTWGNSQAFRIRFTAESGATKGYFFNTKEYITDTTLRPYLEITYSGVNSSNKIIKLQAVNRASTY